MNVATSFAPRVAGRWVAIPVAAVFALTALLGAGTADVAAATPYALNLDVPTSGWIDQGLLLKTTLTQAGQPIRGARVEFILDGTSEGTVTTNTNGAALRYAYFDSVGSHTVQVRGTLTYASAPSVISTIDITAGPTLRIAADDSSLPTAGGTTTLRATVTDGFGGAIKWSVTRSGSWGSSDEPIGETEIDSDGGSSLLVDVAPGGSTFSARYELTEPSNGSWAAAVHVDAKRDLEMTVSVSPNPPTAYESLVTIDVASSGLCPTGTMSFSDVTSTRHQLGSAPAGCSSSLTTRLSNAGRRTIEVSYDGDEVYAPSTQQMSVDVLTDTAVQATGVGRDLSTFYPAKDTYRDQLTIRGNRAEPIGVRIAISNISGRVVRRYSVPVGTDAYSVKWTGRKADGTRVAAGRYRIVQTLTDAAGHTKKFTSWTNVSNMKLYWYSTSQTKAGSGYTSAEHSPLASVTKRNSPLASSVRLAANREGEWAYANWDFVLPKATRYANLRLSVYGDAVSGYGSGYAGVGNDPDGAGSRWLRADRGWTTTKLSPAHVDGRTVRTYVMALGDDLARHDVAKVRLTYSYAVLR